MPVVAKSLTVYFYAIEPFRPAGTRSFAAGQYPLDEVLETVRRSDPTAEEYRIRENLFGGETFCLLHEDGPFPVLGAYYRDNLAKPLTEYKGEIAELLLREGEALVDAAYAAFFPGDVVALVRTSSKAPGFAKLGQWLSLLTGYGCVLLALRDPNVLAQLDRTPTRLRRLSLLIRRNRIESVEAYSAQVAAALRSAAQVNPYSDLVGMETLSPKGYEQAAWSHATRQEIEELLGVLPDFESAKVAVSGRARPFNLLRTSIHQPVKVPLIDTKRVGPAEAAKALVTAFNEERNTIELSLQALHRALGDATLSSI